MKRIEEEGDWDKYDGADWAMYSIHTQHRDAHIINQLRLWQAIRDTDFLKDFRKDYPMKRINQLEERAKKLMQDPETREMLLKGPRGEWWKQFI